jgi:ATP/maltotriose-dependent transcriptional regulator MalT
VTTDVAARSGAGRGARFALGKFALPAPPVTLVARPALLDRLTAGAGQRLTVVLGSAGAGKSVLLSSWAAARPPGVTSWLSCDEADANPIRFWTGFIEADRVIEPRFGADAADLLALDGDVSADLTASIANDAARLPAGSAIILDDFHYAAAAVSRAMTDLVGHWPSQPAQLVLASRADPPLRLHRLVAVATDLLLRGDIARGGEYLDLLERAQPPIAPESRLAAQVEMARATRYMMAGQADQAVDAIRGARAIQERTQLTEEWVAAAPMELLRVYTWLEDLQAVEHEAATALAAPGLTEPVKLVMVPGARALALLEYGRLAEAADAARAAETEARRLGFDHHFWSVDYRRALAGLALELRDLDTAEQLTEQVLSISERRRPPFEFLALLDRATIWATRGQRRDALAAIEAARLALPGAGSALRARADELEALIRLSHGDPSTPTRLANGLPAAHRGLLLARIALAAGDHHAAQDQLRALPPGELTERRALVRQILLAAAAIERGDPMTASAVAGVLHAARVNGFLNTVVTTAPQVTSYLVEHAPQLRPDPFTGQLVAAALQARATQLDAVTPGRGLAEPLTAAELRILKLLPTSTYLQIADTLYISRNTVKVHLRAVYQKLGVASRAQALERAIDLSLL